MVKFFKILGYTVGFLTGVGLALEGVPTNPIRIANDCARMFDNNGATIRKDLVRLGFDLIGEGQIFESLDKILGMSEKLISMSNILKPNTMKLVRQQVKPRMLARLKNRVVKLRFDKTIPSNRYLKYDKNFHSIARK